MKYLHVERYQHIHGDGSVRAYIILIATLNLSRNEKSPNKTEFYLKSSQTYCIFIFFLNKIHEIYIGLYLT